MDINKQVDERLIRGVDVRNREIIAAICLNELRMLINHAQSDYETSVIKQLMHKLLVQIKDYRQMKLMSYCDILNKSCINELELLIPITEMLLEFRGTVKTENEQSVNLENNLI